MLQALRVRPFAQRWLLALAMLLPLAQGAAWLHTLSHATGSSAHEVTGESANEGLVQDQCQLCLITAHLASSAPGPVGLPLQAQAPAALAPASALPAAVSSAPFWRQSARGPPSGAVNSAALLS